VEIIWRKLRAGPHPEREEGTHIYERIVFFFHFALLYFRFLML